MKLELVLLRFAQDVGSRAARSTHEGQMVAKFVDIGEIQTCDECSV